MARREFSRATKRAAWERCGGECEGMVDSETGEFVIDPINHWLLRRCRAPIDTGCFHYDHVDAEWISRDNALINCQVLCVACHKTKTAADKAKIAKVKRIRDRRIKALESRNPLPFGRKSELKKKINGRVVRR